MSNQNVDANLNITASVNEASFAKAEKRMQEIGKVGEKTGKKISNSLENISARNIGKIAEQEAKAFRKVVEEEQRRATIVTEEQSKKRLTLLRRENSEAAISRQIINADRFRRNNLAEINAEVLQREGRRSTNLLSVGSSGGGRRGGGIAGFGRRLLGGGGGGILGGFVGGLASGFGIGLGGMAVARGVEATLAAVEQATAYDRQRVAAEKLAGSQEKLQSLMDSYAKASGGAVNQTTSLANVTRLLATGFANTAPQMEKFVRATRGASIALGKPQEEVTQETQLAISNTSVKRLDQIGLGIEEVQNRIEELRDANSGLTREMAFQQAVLGLLDEKYGALAKSAEGQATAVERLAKAWDDLGLAFGQAAKGPVNDLAEAFNFLAEGAQVALAIRQALINNKAVQDDVFMRKSGADYVNSLLTGISPERYHAARVIQNPEAFGVVRDPVDDSQQFSAGAKAFVRPENQQSLIDAAYDSIQQVEKQANKARLQEIENYERQRESIINNYGKMVVREEEDFARQRARSLRDYERAIVDVIRDAADREQEMQEDLDRRIADAKEDSDDRLVDLQENYNEQREKAEKDHRDAMLKAAGQLDAIAVLEERKAFRRQQEEAKKQHDKAVENEKESLQERIDDAIEAHKERLEDAREADEKRLEDMRVNRARQLADEDEDRAIRLARAAEDHQDQLDELDRQHVKRLDQIKEQAAEETEAIKTALAEDLAEAGFYIKGMTEIMNERKKLQEEWFDAMIERMEKDIEREKRSKELAQPYLPGTRPDRVIPGFASGGFVANTGLAYVHAGERIIPAGSTNSYVNGGNSLVIEDGAFRISTTPGMEMAVGENIEEVLISLLERV